MRSANPIAPGDKFGFLTVHKHARGPRWIVECSCLRLQIIHADRLLDGTAKRCYRCVRDVARFEAAA